MVSAMESLGVLWPTAPTGADVSSRESMRIQKLRERLYRAGHLGVHVATKAKLISATCLALWTMSTLREEVSE